MLQHADRPARRDGTHRAWRSVSHTCGLGGAGGGNRRFGFVLRLECLADDAKPLLAALGLPPTAAAALDAAVAASRPGVALGHADRLLRLRTLYMSDDARDLVAIVGERYKEDAARFGYVFPENSSAPTMRT